MPNVLVIEDDQAIREALVDQLSSSGFQVQAARYGLDGVEQLAASDIDGASPSAAGVSSTTGRTADTFGAP